MVLFLLLNPEEYLLLSNESGVSSEQQNLKY